MAQQVTVAVDAEGALTHVLQIAPEAVPAVQRADLARAWDAARAAAAAMRWGAGRALLFRRADGTPIRLAIADRDARCWAGAVDRLLGLDHVYGVAVCLRLLALVDLIGRAHWLAPLFAVDAGEAVLHPALLAAAASCALDSDARLVEGDVRELLRGITPASGQG
jgi:hypothetical protein